MSKLINFYEEIPEEIKDDPYHNPNKLAPLFPFTACICGATGSGKTLTLMNLLKFCNNFEKIWIWSGSNFDEPLYRLLDSKLPAEEKHFSTDPDDFPSDEEWENIKANGSQNIVIFDDFINAPKKFKQIVSHFISYCRKLNVALCVLSQSYFDIPKFDRKNFQYIILKKNLGNRDLKTILSDFSNLDVDRSTLEDMYRVATEPDDDDPEGILNFLLIDRKTTKPELKFRKNFDGLFHFQ